jgi:hypothetical protein
MYLASRVEISPLQCNAQNANAMKMYMGGREIANNDDDDDDREDNRVENSRT